jgi:hypothetical protein
MVNVLYRLKIYKDINLVNKLNLFTNYLYHTESRCWLAVFDFRLNKLISTNITADLLYDHDQIKTLQVKQTRMALHIT